MSASNRNIGETRATLKILDTDLRFSINVGMIAQKQPHNVCLVRPCGQVKRSLSADCRLLDVCSFIQQQSHNLWVSKECSNVQWCQSRLQVKNIAGIREL